MFEEFFRQSIELCRQAGLLEEGPVYVDSTLMRASASMDSLTKREEMVRPPPSIAEYLQRLGQEADGPEEHGSPDPGEDEGPTPPSKPVPPNQKLVSPEAGPQQGQSAVLGLFRWTPDSDAQHGITGSTMGNVHGSAGVAASADGCSPEPGQSCLPLRVVGKEERVAGSIREGAGHDPRSGRDLVRAYRGDEGPSPEEFYLIRPRKQCERARVRRLRWRRCRGSLRPDIWPRGNHPLLAIQQSVPHGPDRHFLLRGDDQLALHGVDGDPDGHRFEFPGLRYLGV